MSSLSQNEVQFQRENIELELKTQAIMEEVDNLLRNQDRLSTTKSSGYTGSITSDVTGSCYDDGGDNEQIETKTSCSKTITKCIKSKIKGLQDQIINLEKELKKKDESNKKLKTEIKYFDDERIKAVNQLQNTTKCLKRKDDQCLKLTQRIQIIETENANLKKELESLRRDLRQQSSIASGYEVRINRTQEEIDRLKYSIKETNFENKDLKDKVSRETQELKMRNKCLENQKNDLISCIKKQSLLIDNLRKQKIHLEATKALSIGEEEFEKILCWDESACI